MRSNPKYTSRTLLVLIAFIFAASSCHKNTIHYDPVIFELTTTNTNQVPKTIFNTGDTIALNFSMKNVTNENLYLDRDFMRNIQHFFEVFKIDTVNGVVKDTAIGDACFPLLDLRYWVLSPRDLYTITASIPSSTVDPSLMPYYCLSDLNKGKYYVTFSTSFSLMKNTTTRDSIKTRLYHFHINFEIK